MKTKRVEIVLPRHDVFFAAGYYGPTKEFRLVRPEPGVQSLPYVTRNSRNSLYHLTKNHAHFYKLAGVNAFLHIYGDGGTNDRGEIPLEQPLTSHQIEDLYKAIERAIWY